MAADLEKLIRGAAFTVYPSEWYENNPFSVMESQERLVPVIGADIGGIPELIEDGVNGKLFESGNAEALADAIKYLWDNPDELRKYRDNLRQTVKSRLTVNEYADWIVNEIYK